MRNIYGVINSDNACVPSPLKKVGLIMSILPFADMLMYLSFFCAANTQVSKLVLYWDSKVTDKLAYLAFNRGGDNNSHKH